jgi:putative redox protein
MADEYQKDLNDELQGYKKKIVPTTKALLTWKNDLCFTGMTLPGYEIEFDANAQMGCKPTEALLLSLAGCMAIDIVNILQKMRVRLEGFRMELKGERNPDPPQFFRSIEFVMHISGKGLESRKVDRAVSLSRDKYCSVYNTLRKDLEFKVSYVLEGQGPSI